MPSYMVFVQSKNLPTKIHDDVETAVAEARKLASENPNKIVRVLEIIAQYKGTIGVTEQPITAPIPTPAIGGGVVTNNGNVINARYINPYGVEPFRRYVQPTDAARMRDTRPDLAAAVPDIPWTVNPVRPPPTDF